MRLKIFAYTLDIPHNFEAYYKSKANGAHTMTTQSPNKVKAAIFPEMETGLNETGTILCEHSYKSNFMLFWKASDDTAARKALAQYKVKIDGATFCNVGDYRNPLNWNCDFYTLLVKNKTVEKLQDAQAVTMALLLD